MEECIPYLLLSSPPPPDPSTEELALNQPC